MKLKNIFLVALATLGLAACDDDLKLGTLSEVKVSETMISLPTAGGSHTITISATESWSIQNSTQDKKGVHADIPSWVQISPLSGGAGETIVTISGESCIAADGSILGNGVAEFEIVSGMNTQYFRVCQGVKEAAPATCKEIIEGPDGKTYRVTGTVTAIANTTYGNMYINDGTGEVYVYGTLDVKGAEKNFSSLNIEVGDVVTVEGPKTTYGSTVELVNVTVTKIVKSLLKGCTPELSIGKEGGELVAKFVVKGSDFNFSIPAEYQGWISAVGTSVIPGTAKKDSPDTTAVTLLIGANTADARTGSVNFISKKGKDSSEATVTITQEGNIKDATAAEINAAEDGPAVYHYTGAVRKIAQSTYGNMYVADHTGEVYIYGTLDAEGKTKNFASLNIHEGDIITIEGSKSSYKGSPQMPNVSVIAHTSVETISVADFLTKEDNASVYYKLSGTVANLKDGDAYGNFDIVDDSGSVYVYGLLKGWGGAKKLFQELGIVNGDTITIVGVHASYKGTIQVGSAFFLEKTTTD